MKVVNEKGGSLFVHPCVDPALTLRVCYMFGIVTMRPFDTSAVDAAKRLLCKSPVMMMASTSVWLHCIAA